MARSDAAAAQTRDKTHWLYLAVLAAAVAGVLLGLVAPGIAVQLKPLGDTFISLVKMMIGPIIFCTIVLGIGSVRQAGKLGKVGGVALGWPRQARP